MKKQLAFFSLVLLAFNNDAQTTWSTSLNTGASSPKFGLSTNHPLKFYTNNALRVTLTGTGRFGIGTADPTSELHVVGKGLFTSDLRTNGSLYYSDNFKVQYTKAAVGSGIPDVYYTGSGGSGPSKFKGPCNVWYKDPTQYDQNGLPYSIPWQPSTANVYDELLQVVQVGLSPQSALSMGVVSTGDGVIAIEPNQSATTTKQKLKLNPGCTNDVFICEGGGFTKIFNSAAVEGYLNVSSNIRVGSAPFSSYARFEIKASNAYSGLIYAWDPVSTATNKGIFQVANTGKTTIGTNVSSNNAMLTIGQSTKADRALCLTDNTSTTNKDFFNVYGNGYSEIKVYSPTNMPSNRVLVIKDMANSRDLFVVKADGKVYAREVEVSIATTFPDYVFEKNYPLKPIAEVERFITENKCLPGFEKGTHYEENGINVSDLLLKQQEKLEEQMLYIIQLEKRLVALEKSK